LTTNCAVALDRATPETAPLLAEMLEQYVREMSAFFPVTPGEDGRYHYDALPLYWSRPDVRFAFIIRCGGAAAGFALATRGSPAGIEPDDLDVAEFFVLHEFRRSGIGRRAAAALWNEMRGTWVVRVSEANPRGLAFWTRAVRDYASNAFVESTLPGLPGGWRIFRFSSI
jgi:predicted acetyltransferase